jgi:glutathione S-transferase
MSGDSARVSDIFLGATSFLLTAVWMTSLVVKANDASDGINVPKDKFKPKDGINFYYHIGSPCARRVWLTFLEKKIDFHGFNVLLNTGEQRSESYLNINPHGKVPAVVVRNHPTIRDCTLFESQAIVEWLEDQFPSTKPLYPGSFEGKMIIKLWQYWELAVAEEIWPLSRHNVL